MGEPLDLGSILKIANAAGRDAGNRSMRKAGRSKWGADDWMEAARVCTEVTRAMGAGPMIAPDDLFVDTSDMKGT